MYIIFMWLTEWLRWPPHCLSTTEHSHLVELCSTMTLFTLLINVWQVVSNANDELVPCVNLLLNTIRKPSRISVIEISMPNICNFTLRSLYSSIRIQRGNFWILKARGVIWVILGVQVADGRQLGLLNTFWSTLHS